MYKQHVVTELSSDEDIFEYFTNDMMVPLQEHVSNILACNDPTQKTAKIAEMWVYIEATYKTIEAKFKTSIANTKLIPESTSQFLKGGKELKPSTKLFLRVASVTKKTKKTDSKFI
jgi:hypothetical protein